MLSVFDGSIFANIIRNVLKLPRNAENHGFYAITLQ